MKLAYEVTMSERGGRVIIISAIDKNGMEEEIMQQRIQITVNREGKGKDG